jgi:hypothetical protein
LAGSARVAGSRCPVFDCSRPCGRRLDAAQPAIQAHTADAFLIAGQAQPDIVHSIFAGLPREFGIGDLGPDDADQIRMAFGQQPLRLDRILDPPDSDDRQPLTALRIAEGMNIA